MTPFGKPIKIGVAGAHSTGKTTFLLNLRKRLEIAGLSVEIIPDFGPEAIEAGFEVFTGHTFESTAWYIGRGLELEAKAALANDVILVDRPVPDAIGYLLAALEYSGRTIPANKVSCLMEICRAWVAEYSILFVTVLDESVTLGAGRPDNARFRRAASAAIHAIFEDLAPWARALEIDGHSKAIEVCLDYLGLSKVGDSGIPKSVSSAPGG